MIEHPAFQESLSELTCIGFEVCDANELGAVVYAIVGGRSNARWWLIPLTNRRVTAAGFSLFQPVLLSAKLMKWATVLFTNLGLSCLWSRKKIYLRNNGFFKSIFGEDNLHFALFTGTDSPHRKVTVQIMGRNGSIKGFAKVSCNPLVQPLLVHEAETLGYLSTLNLQRTIIPKVLFSDEIGGAAVLVTDTLKTGKSKTATKLTDVHLAFLRELSEKTAVSGTIGTDWVTLELRHKYNAVVARLPEEWQKRLNLAISCLESSKMEWGARCLSHGDFTPWNTFFVDDKLYVFDWEYESQKLPDGYDLIHFIYSLPSVKCQKPKDSVKQVRKALKAMAYATDNIADTLFLCYLCSQTLQYILREINSTGKVVTWDGEEKASAMIDTLLQTN